MGEISRGKLTIKDTGKPVTLPGNRYGQANFHIRGSQSYFKGKKFRTFVYFYYIQYVYPLIFLASIPVFVSSDGKYPFAMFTLNMVFALIYIQHLHVIVNTMRYVLKQITIPDMHMSYNNEHLEITMEVFNAKYAKTSEVAAGIVIQASGTVKIQVFKRTKITEMRRTCAISLLSLVGSLGMVFYCFGHGFSQVFLANVDHKHFTCQILSLLVTGKDMIPAVCA